MNFSENMKNKINKIKMSLNDWLLNFLKWCFVRSLVVGLTLVWRSEEFEVRTSVRTYKCPWNDQSNCTYKTSIIYFLYYKTSIIVFYVPCILKNPLSQVQRGNDLDKHADLANPICQKASHYVEYQEKKTTCTFNLIMIGKNNI